MKKVVVISSASFFRPGPRVGMQFIAEILARNGLDVYYLSQPSSPLDALSARRWQRFQQCWLGKDRCREIEPNLREHFVMAPFPTSKRFWLTRRQYDWYGSLLPRVLKKMSFDLCLHDISSNFPLLEHLSFTKLLLRLSDRPEGFAHTASGIAIEKLLGNIAAGKYDQTWSVSQALRDYAARLQPGGTHVLMSNGVDYQRFLANPSRAGARAKTALFVGAVDRWCDVPLLEAAARLLPDWQLDIYGPAAAGMRTKSANLVFKGPVDYTELPKLLGGYTVGLIPFRDDPLVAMMERPLKFYEYVAAGLGVAATDVGRLKEGMGAWAHYGRTSQGFADAIVSAAADCGRNLPNRYAYLENFSWTRIGKQVQSCIEKALGSNLYLDRMAS